MDAVGVGEVRGDAGVEISSAEGGLRERIEGDVGHGAELRGPGGGAGVEREGADIAVPAGEVPAGGNLEGYARVGIVETAGRWGLGLCGDGGLELRVSLRCQCCEQQHGKREELGGELHASF